MIKWYDSFNPPLWTQVSLVSTLQQSFKKCTRACGTRCFEESHWCPETLSQLVGYILPLWAICRNESWKQTYRGLLLVHWRNPDNAFIAAGKGFCSLCYSPKWVLGEYSHHVPSFTVVFKGQIYTSWKITWPNPHYFCATPLPCAGVYQLARFLQIKLPDCWRFFVMIPCHSSDY